MGHSFGGTVAMFYATRHPQHPARLILTSTRAQPVGEQSLLMLEKLGGERACAAAVGFWMNPGIEAAKRCEEFVYPAL